MAKEGSNDNFYIPPHTLKSLSKFIIPYEGIRIVSTKDDEEHIEAFAGRNGRVNLVCSVCGNSNFKVKVLIEAEAVVNSLIKPALITELDPFKVHVINLIECDDCHCEVFMHQRKIC